MQTLLGAAALGEMLLAHPDALPVGEGDEHRAHLVDAVAVGPGEAGYADAEVRVHELAHAAGELDGDLVAHGALFLYELRRDAEQTGLGLVRVDHDAAAQRGARAGDVGDRFRELAAGAALGRREGDAPLYEELRRELGEARRVHAVGEGAEHIAHALYDGGHHALGLVARGRARRDADEALGVLRVGGEGGVRERIHVIAQPVLHLALAYAEEVYRV